MVTIVRDMEPIIKTPQRTFFIIPKLLLTLIRVVNLLRHFGICPEPTYPSWHMHL